MRTGEAELDAERRGPPAGGQRARRSRGAALLALLATVVLVATPLADALLDSHESAAPKSVVDDACALCVLSHTPIDPPSREVELAVRPVSAESSTSLPVPAFRPTSITSPLGPRAPPAT